MKASKALRARLARHPVLGLALGLSLATGVAHATDTVTVALAIPPTVTDGGVWSIGDALGIWKKENLEVKTITFAGAGTLVPQVASGHATVGLPVVDPILAAYAAGRGNLPVQYFYNATPTNTLEYAVLANSPIKTIAQLKGKKIGVGALTWGTIPTSRAVLKEAGLSEVDYQIVPVGILGSGFQALRTGQVAALNYNSSWHDQLELTGTKIRRLTYPGVFGDVPANGFIANSDALKKDPDLYARFGRAYTEALYACSVNVKACVETFWKEHPETRPSSGDPTKNLADAEELVRRRLVRVMNTPDGKPVVPGQFNLALLTDYIKHMAADGEFKSTNVPVNELFSNALVPEFSKFDTQTVRREALALH